MNGITAFTKLRNSVAIGTDEVPEFDFGRFRRAIVDAAGDGARVSAFFGGIAGPTDPAVDLYAVLADDTAGVVYVAKTRVKHDEFHSLTPDCPQVHMFEREIAEQFGLRPEGIRGSNQSASTNRRDPATTPGEDLPTKNHS